MRAWASGRGSSIPDLIIAATAELSGLTILHVDNDFDTITAVTGQPTTRLAFASTAKGGRWWTVDKLEQASESTAN
ncbi:hypothetical protein [Mycobacterium simulans]|uniref:hypothetical protein n=1 Tax=Mycobacterium simulans TaxID=627089 RepID=UPI0037CB06F0